MRVGRPHPIVVQAVGAYAIAVAIVVFPFSEGVWYPGMTCLAGTALLWFGGTSPFRRRRALLSGGGRSPRT
jgi:hypothetical protein